MHRPLNQHRDWEQNPAGAFHKGRGVAPANAREIKVQIDSDPLASFVGELGAPEGIWLHGAIAPEDITAAAALPGLRELHVRPAVSPARPAGGQITEPMVAALRGKRLDRLRLSVLSREAVAALEGLAVRALAVTVGKDGDTDLATLFALPVEVLHLKGQGIKVPLESIERLVMTATVRTLVLEDVELSADVIARLGSIPSLRSLTLQSFGTPGEVRFDRAPALAELELLGTRIDSVALAHLPALSHLDVQHCASIALTDLPRLSVFEAPAFTGPLHLSLEGLPALRQLLARNVTLETLTTSSVPALARVDLRGATVSDAVLTALKGLELVRDTHVKKRKRTEPKRKVIRWTHAKLGLSDEPVGVLIAGRLYHRDVSSGKVTELATACEWWAQQEDRHIATVVPQCVGSGEVGAPALVVGEVLATVREGENVAMAASLEGVDARLAKIYEEACGIVGDDHLAGVETRLYFVACGRGACLDGKRVALDDAWCVEARDSAQVHAVDVHALPWVSVAPSGELTLTFRRG